jgi:mannose-6-phosphate isomerase-like protein (cupin superfamily)
MSILNQPERQSSLEVETWYSDDIKSVAFIVLSGLNNLTVNHKSTTVYEIIDGSGTVTIEGTSRELTGGDTFVAFTGQAYQDEGNLTMLATSVPPFDLESVEVLK